MPKLSENSQKARELLAQGKKPSEIAETLGLKTYGWIYRLKKGGKKSTKQKKTAAVGKRAYRKKDQGPATAGGLTYIWTTAGAPVGFASKETAQRQLGSNTPVYQVAVIA